MNLHKIEGLTADECMHIWNAIHELPMKFAGAIRDKLVPQFKAQGLIQEPVQPPVLTDEVKVGTATVTKLPTPTSADNPDASPAI